jgi:hypothetical protein
MSAISSYFSSATAYQALDRNSFAHSSEAIGGTKQAFAESDEEGSHRGSQPDDDFDKTRLATESEAPAAATTNQQHGLNVTA